MNKMNKYLLFLTFLLCVMFMIGCKDDAFSDHALVEVSFTEEAEETSDGSRGLVPDYYGRGSVRLVRNYEPNDLFWLYTAEHKYNVSTGHQSSVYATGETPRDASGNLIKQPVSPDGGYGFADYKKILSAGDWEIKLYGYDSSNQAGCTDEKLIYTSTKTVTVTESTSLQRVPFTLTLDSDYSKRYLFVTSFDVKITDYGQRHTNNGSFNADFFFIKKDLSGLVKGTDSSFRCSCTTAGTFTWAVGNTLHFEDSAGRYEVGDAIVDNNGYVHFFSKIHHSGTNWHADVSDVLVVPTKPGFTTYIDGKVLSFGNINKVGGTLFYINSSASGCYYYFMDSILNDYTTAMAVSTNYSSNYYLCHDYNGTGHVDKYYVWNENLISGTLRWMDQTEGLTVSGSISSVSSYSAWESYSVGANTYSMNTDTGTSSLSNLGKGRGNTEYLINIYRRGYTNGANQYCASYWESKRWNVAPYIRNIRATKANGCDDWYVPSISELYLLLVDSTRRTTILNHVKSRWNSTGSSVSYCVSSSTMNPNTLGQIMCYASASSAYSGAVWMYGNVGVVPIRSF